ncbi:MAG TPA: MarR family winged helix-turn-helix transcriptional regulator [Polyangiaceae bacterium]|nr:MarR family winged helix-turn-helix transcriptional regulator [Polyangiaceae bacterium]
MQSTEAQDDAAASVLDSLRWLVRALRVTSHSVERDLGITGAQLFVLREIAAEPGCSIRRLSERTLTDPSSVSVVVSRLVERGLIVRRQDAADARRTELSLTARGERLLSRASEPFQVRLVRALRTLPPANLNRLARDLATVVHTVGAGDGAPPMFFDDEPKRRTRRGR